MCGFIKFFKKNFTRSKLDKNSKKESKLEIEGPVYTNNSSDNEDLNDVFKFDESHLYRRRLGIKDEEVGYWFNGYN